MNTKTAKYMREHQLFTFIPTESEDYEIWEEMKISDQLKPYTDWFKSNGVPAKKYNFKKYVNPGKENGFLKTVLDKEAVGYVTVQIFDRKTDALFRLTWL